jgi:hypothetical protein
MSIEGGAGWRWSWSVEAAGGKLKYLVDLFARDVELFDDFVDRGAGFEVFEYGGDRACAYCETPMHRSGDRERFRRPNIAPNQVSASW